MEFKIQKPEYVNRTYRLPKDLVEQLSEAAQREGVSSNEFVCQACKFALDHLDTANDTE